MQIGNRNIGKKFPCFFIAEMSANHDRDLEHALKLVDVAAASGADAIKLQTYSPESLTIRSQHKSTLLNPIWGYKTLYDLYEAAAMPMEFHAPLLKRARKLGIIAFTSVYDPMDLDFCESLGICAYKIASFELVHFPLLRAVASTGKPIILSTGMAKLGDVEEALEVLMNAGAKEIALLHCCSAYPAPATSINLTAMATLYSAFGLPVGFSDHTLGTHIPIAAVALGASIIEKHFTTDSKRIGPDHRFSLEPNQLTQLIHGIREVESSIGDGSKRMADEEKESKRMGRRSLYAVNSIAAGQQIHIEDVRIVRPGEGLHPRELSFIVDRIARRNIPAGSPLSWNDL